MKHHQTSAPTLVRAPRWRLAAALCLATIALLALAPAASAQPGHLPDLVTGGNRWIITFFDDSSPGHTQWASQGLCFVPIASVGTHKRYRWFSDTFPDWNGIASQEGDQITMHGDYDRNRGHDSMSWDIMLKDAGGGHWVEWRENPGFGNTIGFGNSSFYRIGKCERDDPPVLGPAIAEDGRVLDNPRDR